MKKKIAYLQCDLLNIKSSAIISLHTVYVKPFVKDFKGNDDTRIQKFAIVSV